MRASALCGLLVVFLAQEKRLLCDARIWSTFLKYPRSSGSYEHPRRSITATPISRQLHMSGTLSKRGERVPAKEGSERALAMGSFLKGMLLAWLEIQKAEFPHLVKKWRRQKVPCGREWDETAPVCSSYYGTHMNPDNYGKWMRALMVERGLGEYTTHSEWVDSRGIARVKHGGYVGPSYKSLRSFGATYLIGENVDVKTAQAHFGHKRSSTTLELYAEQVPKHEREVAKTMDAFVKAALGDEMIERAAELSGVKKSAFMREAALEKAARILVAAG